jgi:hypothetical protein
LIDIVFADENLHKKNHLTCLARTPPIRIMRGNT